MYSSETPYMNAHINEDYSLYDSLEVLRRYIAGNDIPDEDFDIPACDHFRMYEFKVRHCVRARSHDWTHCPYVHPGEKARRRDPRKFHYTGTACTDYRKGSCKKGDSCEFSHGVFECWLHPTRYRTQLCKDGLRCRRRVCFFAHSEEEVRVLSPTVCGSSDASTRRLCFDGQSSSSTESPPMSPMTTYSRSRSLGSSSLSQMVVSLRQLHLNKVNNNTTRGLQMSIGSPGSSLTRDMTRFGFSSLPSTPAPCLTRPGSRYVDVWDNMNMNMNMNMNVGEEPVLERVESGSGLRAKMFEKLSKENPLNRVDPNHGNDPEMDPDFAWVSQ